MTTIAEKVKNIVATQLCLDVNQVLPNSNFANDLGADSLDMVELVMGLEEAFEIDIPEEIASSISTVDEAVACISEKLGKEE